MLHETNENYSKMANEAIEFELADDETLPVLKFELREDEKDQIKVS